jgi:hypothetical protein
MRAREFIKENTVSGDVAVLAQPLGAMISRLGHPKSTKYSNSAPSMNDRKKRHARG